MAEAMLIGIDAGTSVLKAVAFTTPGEQLAVAAIPNDYVTLPDGRVEQDMTRTWADAVATLKQLGEKILDLAPRLVAISVTAQGDGMSLIDSAGEPVGSATISLDNRCASIVDEYVDIENDAAHYKRTGTGLTVMQMSRKLAWMQRNHPEQVAKAKTA